MVSVLEGGAPARAAWTDCLDEWSDVEQSALDSACRRVPAPTPVEARHPAAPGARLGRKRERKRGPRGKRKRGHASCLRRALAASLRRRLSLAAGKALPAWAPLCAYERDGGAAVPPCPRRTCVPQGGCHTSRAWDRWPPTCRCATYPARGRRTGG